MLLVAAANGNQGRLLVPKLLARGLPVRACVRSQASGERLHALGVADVVVGDIADPAVLARAMEGVRTVYHVGPVLHPRERAIGMAAVDAARAAGVGHFVFSSVLHAIITDLTQHEIKRDIEEYLLASGLAFTILQPTIYMLPQRIRPAFETGVFRVGWSRDRLQSLVALDDVTDVVCTVLAEGERHWGATYELAGPGWFTARDLGAVIARVVGRPVTVEEVDASAYRKGLLGPRDPGEDSHEAAVIRALCRRYSDHDFVGNPNVLTHLLGRAPTSFEAFVREEHAAFARRGRGA